MATTRIMALHTGKGRSVAKALRNITDYMENPEKTEGGELILSFECSPESADALCCKGRFLRTPTKSMAARPSVAV